MADNIFETTHSLGQTRYTRIDDTHDNENLVDQISKTAAIGNAEGSGTEGSEACANSSAWPKSQSAFGSPNPSSTR